MVTLSVLAPVSVAVPLTVRVVPGRSEFVAVPLIEPPFEIVPT